jgi:hypothetical protein
MHHRNSEANTQASSAISPSNIQTQVPETRRQVLCGKAKLCRCLKWVGWQSVWWSMWLRNFDNLFSASKEHQLQKYGGRELAPFCLGFSTPPLRILMLCPAYLAFFLWLFWLFWQPKTPRLGGISLQRLQRVAFYLRDIIASHGMVHPYGRGRDRKTKERRITPWAADEFALLMAQFFFFANLSYLPDHLFTISPPLHLNPTTLDIRIQSCPCASTNMPRRYGVLGLRLQVPGYEVNWKILQASPIIHDVFGLVSLLSSRWPF